MERAYSVLVRNSPLYIQRVFAIISWIGFVNSFGWALCIVTEP
jgi:hypothetical protein